MHKPMNPNAGIAIGPILFIIAILAILAAAIAAGSGSFTGGTTKEANKVNASAIVGIGQNLKFGWDKIMANGVDPTIVTFDATATTGLFAPTGGGITPPSNTLAAAGQPWCWIPLSHSGAGCNRFRMCPDQSDHGRKLQSY